ncbi:hypothetical protein E2C01_021022 [Portunus trituberculatus]|uniref:Uncharacterized protein n=1 Tax=Portunus trituberculatus TaxID=210409 RepID=A0A5B7E3A5_PORTR|nr:hypothetical protein [Portunus trituberculatus]
MKVRSSQPDPEATRKAAPRASESAFIIPTLLSSTAKIDFLTYLYDLAFYSSQESNSHSSGLFKML